MSFWIVISCRKIQVPVALSKSASVLVERGAGRGAARGLAFKCKYLGTEGASASGHRPSVLRVIFEAKLEGTSGCFPRPTWSLQEFPQSPFSGVFHATLYFNPLCCSPQMSWCFQMSRTSWHWCTQRINNSFLKIIHIVSLLSVASRRSSHSDVHHHGG